MFDLLFCYYCIFVYVSDFRSVMFPSSVEERFREFQVLSGNKNHGGNINLEEISSNGTLFEDYRISCRASPFSNVGYDTGIS